MEFNPALTAPTLTECVAAGALDVEEGIVDGVWA